MTWSKKAQVAGGIASGAARRRKAGYRHSYLKAHPLANREGRPLYHGTIDRYVPSIQKLGLVPRPNAHNYTEGGDYLYKGSRDRSVFLTSTKTEARMFARQIAERRGGKPAIVQVTLPRKLLLKVHRDRDFGSRTTYYYKGAIPASFVRKL